MLLFLLLLHLGPGPSPPKAYVKYVLLQLLLPLPTRADAALLRGAATCFHRSLALLLPPIPGAD